MRFCFLSPNHRSLHVLAGDSRASGGAEAQVARIAAALAEQGHEVSLIYGSGGSGATTRINGVSCIDGYPAWSRPATLTRFWRTLDRLRPAVLYARLPDDFLALVGLYAAARPATRFVYGLAHDRSCNPWRTFEYKAWFHNTFYALGLRAADVVAVQHEGQVPLVRPHTGGKLIHIPNLGPAFTGAPRAFTDTTIDVVWVAQIRPVKQLAILLDLAERLPQLRFAVVGGFDEKTTEPDERAYLQSRIDRLANLQFYGAQPAAGVAAALRQSKLLINTSQSEGFPNAMLEAWNLGLPVVSLYVDPGGVIRRHQLGLVSGNVERLADVVLRLCEDRNLNEACGARGFAYVRDHHSVEVVCEQFMQLASGAGRGPLTAQEGCR